jgi:hypothetical protein
LTIGDWRFIDDFAIDDCGNQLNAALGQSPDRQ